MVKTLDKCGKSASDLHFIISGDLQNQCTAASYAFRDVQVPFLGIYGACSTMAESLSIGAILIDGGAAEMTACITSAISARQKNSSAIRWNLAPKELPPPNGL